MALFVVSYNPKQEVLNLCVPRHDLISLVSDYVSNLSFHSLLTAFADMPHAPLPAVEPIRFDPKKTYVAVVRSDGDNLQIVMGGNRGKMEERLALCAAATEANRSVACPFMTHTLSNRLLEFGPHVLRWFFAAAHTTGRDAFVMGPSGFGYNVSLATVCPSLLTTRSPDAYRCCRQFPSLISPPQKQAEFAAATASAAEQLGWEGYCHWDLPHGAEDIRAYIQRLDGTAIKGVFATDVAGAFLPSRIGSVEVFTSHQLLDQPPSNISTTLNGLPRGSTSFLYEIWDTTMEQPWAALLEPHVELVGHRELIELRRQSRARAQLKLDDDSEQGYPFMPLYKLPQDDGAACLDGSPPAFWFLEGAESTK